MHCQPPPNAQGLPYVMSLWLSGLLRFLSHRTCWVYLAGDLQRPGSNPGRGMSVGWTNGRYAMRLISRTGTEGPPVSSRNCDRCRLWSYDITAGYKCEYYYYYFFDTLGINDPEGFWKKIKWNTKCWSDHYSGQSSWMNDSCSRMLL